MTHSARFSRVSLFMAVFFLQIRFSVPDAFGAVSAYQIRSSAVLLSGVWADGQLNDYMLENDLIAVVISDIGHTEHYAISGGNILDAGPSIDRIDALGELYTRFNDGWFRQADYSSLAIIDDGGNGGPAVIRVSGVDSEDSSLTVVTEYSLADDAEYLIISTAVTNTGAGTYADFGLGDVLYWCGGVWGCQKFVPGYGYGLSPWSTTSEPWLAGTAKLWTSKLVSYGYTSPSDTLWGLHGAAWSRVNITAASLSPGDSCTYSRHFVVMGADIASVATVIHQIWGTPVGAIVCSVSAQLGGEPIPKAEIDVFDSLDAAYLHMVADSAGHTFTTLPIGDWRLVASAFGYHSDEIWLSVAEGDTASYHYVLEPDHTIPPKGDTLTVIQRPLLNIPALVRSGDTLTIECEADPATTDWTAELNRGQVQVPLTVYSSTYEPSTLWWTISAGVPQVPVSELYDLVVTANAGIEDTTRNAVRVIPEFKDDYYFIHITDTHLPTHLYHYEYWSDTDTSEIIDLRHVIADINIINPEFVLLTGDFVNQGSLEDTLNRRYYTRGQRVLTEFQVPVFLTSGNHDIGDWSPTPGTARRDWWRLFGWKRLDDPPPGAPWYTQNYSFDYGPVHYIGLEAYTNTDMWRSEIYGAQSFTSGQMQWLSEDLTAASGSISQVLFYHYDFSHQIDLSSLGLEMALWGHLHYDVGSITFPPYSLATDNTCDEARSYRIIRVADGILLPTATISAGYSGNNLEVQYTPANNGMHSQVTAEITNDLDERFEYSQLRFLMPNDSGDIQVTGGNLVQVDSSRSPAVCYVGVDILPNSSQTVTVSLRPPAIIDLQISLSENDLALTWSPPGEQAVAHYVIYRNTGPYFVPTSGDSIGGTSDTTYSDAGMAGTPGLNHYYAVKAVSDSGEKSDPSNIVGEFDLDLSSITAR